MKSYNNILKYNAFNFVFIVILFGATDLMAGPRVIGNGADAVVCRDNSGKVLSAKLLDLYEMEMEGISIDLGDENLSVGHKVEYILSKIKSLAPTRFKIYSEGSKKFITESKFQVGNALPDIPDSGEIILPRGCGLEQVIVQTSCYAGIFGRQECPEGISDSYMNWDEVFKNRYLIDQSVWSAFDNNSKAASIVHELIFRERKNLLENHTTSDGVRNVNRMLLSKEISSLDQLQFNSFLKANGFTIGDYSYNSTKGMSSFFVYNGEEIRSIKYVIPPILDRNGGIVSASLFYGNNPWSTKVIPAIINGKNVSFEIHYSNSGVWGQHSPALKVNEDGLPIGVGNLNSVYLGQLDLMKRFADENYHLSPTLSKNSNGVEVDWAGITYKTRRYRFFGKEFFYTDIYAPKKFNFMGKSLEFGHQLDSTYSPILLDNDGNLFFGILNESTKIQDDNFFTLELNPGSSVEMTKKKNGKIELFAVGKVLGDIYNDRKLKELNIGGIKLNMKMHLRNADVIFDSDKVDSVNGDISGELMIARKVENTGEEKKYSILFSENYKSPIGHEKTNSMILILGKTSKPLVCLYKTKNGLSKKIEAQNEVYLKFSNHSAPVVVSAKEFANFESEEIFDPTTTASGPIITNPGPKDCKLVESNN